jgi:hypothetical protein
LGLEAGFEKECEADKVLNLFYFPDASEEEGCGQLHE